MDKEREHPFFAVILFLLNLEETHFRNKKVEDWSKNLTRHSDYKPDYLNRRVEPARMRSR